MKDEFTVKYATTSDNALSIKEVYDVIKSEKLKEQTQLLKQVKRLSKHRLIDLYKHMPVLIIPQDWGCTHLIQPLDQYNCSQVTYLYWKDFMDKRIMIFPLRDINNDKGDFMKSLQHNGNREIILTWTDDIRMHIVDRQAKSQHKEKPLENEVISEKKTDEIIRKLGGKTYLYDTRLTEKYTDILTSWAETFKSTPFQLKRIHSGEFIVVYRASGKQLLWGNCAEDGIHIAMLKRLEADIMQKLGRYIEKLREMTDIKLLN